MPPNIGSYNFMPHSALKSIQSSLLARRVRWQDAESNIWKGSSFCVYHRRTCFWRDPGQVSYLTTEFSFKVSCYMCCLHTFLNKLSDAYQIWSPLKWRGQVERFGAQRENNKSVEWQAPLCSPLSSSGSWGSGKWCCSAQSQMISCKPCFSQM